MPFYYPNYGNDMWRILGHLLLGDFNALVDTAHRTYYQERIEQLLQHTGIAVYDAATAVRRMTNNASDKNLVVMEPADIAALLRRCPTIEALAATGARSLELTLTAFGLSTPPKISQSVTFPFEERTIALWRMPSTSRAYPQTKERKAESYACMLRALGMLPG